MVMIDKTNFQPFLPTCQCSRLRGLLTITCKKGTAAARSTTSCGLSTPLTAEVLHFRGNQPAGLANHYKMVMIGKRNFQGDQQAVEPLALLFQA